MFRREKNKIECLSKTLNIFNKYLIKNDAIIMNTSFLHISQALLFVLCIIFFSFLCCVFFMFSCLTDANDKCINTLSKLQPFFECSWFLFWSEKNEYIFSIKNLKFILIAEKQLWELYCLWHLFVVINRANKNTTAKTQQRIKMTSNFGKQYKSTNSYSLSTNNNLLNGFGFFLCCNHLVCWFFCTFFLL